MTSSRYLIVTSVLVVALVGYMYAESLAYLFSRWVGTEDYSHGTFAPLISGFLV